MPRPPALLLLPRLAARLDELEAALERLKKGVPPRQVERITLGLRRGADALILVLEPGPSFGNHVGPIAVAEAQLPGLSLVELAPAAAGQSDDPRERALASCELTLVLERPSRAVAALRKALGAGAPEPEAPPSPAPPEPAPAPPPQRQKPSELRSTPRVSTRLEVTFATGEEVAREWTENLSRGGAFVRTTTPPPRNSVVQLTLHLPGGRSVELTGEVVHVVDVMTATASGSPPGCGLAFQKLQPEVEAALTEHVHSVLARSLRTMLVGGTEELRRQVRPALEAAGCEVLEVDGDAALERIIDEILDLDLLLVDVSRAPLVTQLRSLGERELKVAILAPAPGREERGKLLMSGADEVLDATQPPATLAARAVALRSPSD